MVRSRFRLVAALLALAGLAGCGGAGDDVVDVMVIGQGQPRLADPADGPLSAPQAVMVQNVAQGLVRLDSRGQIEPGLAERWNVSDDGLSYIFRLQSGRWPDNRSIHARDVARLLKRQLRPGSHNELKDSLGAIDDIVAMTDRVIEIRLRAPRPNFLQLLAQPELGLVREGVGSGPFQPAAVAALGQAVDLVAAQRVVDAPDVVDRIRLSTAPAAAAVAAFAQGKARLVLGGTFDELPLARAVKLDRSALRFDPVAGLFGLVPARASGAGSDRALRLLLTRAIDRDALLRAFDVPGLVPRATLLQSGLEGVPAPAAPDWFDQPLADRRPALARAAAALVEKYPTLFVALPDGPGGRLLLGRLARDWGALGFRVERAGRGTVADFRLIDRVAPSPSPAWFVRAFRCTVVPVCRVEADGLMDSARDTLAPEQRAAFLAEAARLLDEGALFLPLAAPIRWSLVADGLPGFVENATARHRLLGLARKPGSAGD